MKTFNRKSEEWSATFEVSSSQGSRNDVNIQMQPISFPSEFLCMSYQYIKMNSLNVYLIHLNRWTLLSNMLKHRSAAGVAFLDGEIYACGGHDGLSIFDSVRMI